MSQVLRIVFKSGRIAERRGNDYTVEKLFYSDIDNVIDYVMSVDMITGCIGFFTDVGDVRFSDEVVLTCPAIIHRDANPDSP